MVYVPGGHVERLPVMIAQQYKELTQAAVHLGRFQTSPIKFTQSFSGRLCIAVHKIGVNVGRHLV